MTGRFELKRYLLAAWTLISQVQECMLSEAVILLAPVAVKISFEPWWSGWGGSGGSDRAEAIEAQRTADERGNFILLHDIAYKNESSNGHASSSKLIGRDTWIQIGLQMRSQALRKKMIP
jgi:hypothetical protein